MAHSPIYAFLRDITGIDVSSIGEATVSRVINNLMKANGQKTVEGYLSCLRASSSERQALINEITVQETWFFRDHEPFTLFSDYVTKVWPPGKNGKFKVLSVPCSTGEEPYSIAMILLEAGFSHDSFIIDAADISTRALGLAKRGVYGRNSFRGGESSFYTKYFSERGGQYELSDEVKKAVSFHHQNILAPDFMEGRGPYNAVFCRNLLIYFDLATKERVIRSLRNFIFHDGVLFLGHAETGRMVHGVFESLRHPGAFAYQPAGTGRPSPSLGSVESFSIPEAVDKKEPMSDQDIAAAVITPCQSDQGDQNTQATQITAQEIQALADKGDLQGAMRLCCLHIQRNPLSADGYYLQGIILLAEDEDEKAFNSFKRAVYLEPNHYQALAHLAVLAEEFGEFKAAANYRARIERAKLK